MSGNRAESLWTNTIGKTQNEIEKCHKRGYEITRWTSELERKTVDRKE